MRFCEHGRDTLDRAYVLATDAADPGRESVERLVAFEAWAADCTRRVERGESLCEALDAAWHASRRLRPGTPLGAIAMLTATWAYRGRLWARPTVDPDTGIAYEPARAPLSAAERFLRAHPEPRKATPCDGAPWARCTKCGRRLPRVDMGACQAQAQRQGSVSVSINVITDRQARRAQRFAHQMAELLELLGHGEDRKRRRLDSLFGWASAANGRTVQLRLDRSGPVDLLHDAGARVLVVAHWWEEWSDLARWFGAVPVRKVGLWRLDGCMEPIGPPPDAEDVDLVVVSPNVPLLATLRHLNASLAPSTVVRRMAREWRAPLPGRIRTAGEASCGVTSGTLHDASGLRVTPALALQTTTVLSQPAAKHAMERQIGGVLVVFRSGDHGHRWLARELCGRTTVARSVSHGDFYRMAMEMEHEGPGPLSLVLILDDRHVPRGFVRSYVQTYGALPPVFVTVPTGVRS